MLNEILEINLESAGPVWSLMSKLSYAAAVVSAGRKFCLAASYKIGGSVGGAFGLQKAAMWNKASQDSFSTAKRDAIYDLILATELIALGFVLGQVDSLLENAEIKLDRTKKILQIMERMETVGRIATIAVVFLAGAKWASEYHADKIASPFS